MKMLQFMISFCTFVFLSLSTNCHSSYAIAVEGNNVYENNAAKEYNSKIQTLIILDNIVDKYKYSIIFDTLSKQKNHHVFYQTPLGTSEHQHSSNRKSIIIKQYNRFIYQNIIFLTLKSNKASFHEQFLNEIFEYIEYGGNVMLFTDEHMISNSIVIDISEFMGISFNNTEEYVIRRDVDRDARWKKESEGRHDEFYNPNTRLVMDHFHVISDLDNNERY